MFLLCLFGGEGVLKLNQYLCRHDYKYIAKHKQVNENLWQCKKCKVFYIEHWGIGLGYKSKTPHLTNWIYSTTE